MSTGNCNIPLLVFLAAGFLKTYFLYIMFSRAHLLRTLFIFRLEKALVCRMMYNRKFQPQASSFIGSYIRVFSVLSTRCHTKGPTNLQVLIYGFLVYSLPGVTQKVLPIYRFLYTGF